MTAEEMLNSIGSSCRNLSEDIIDKVCKRAMTKINKDLKFGFLFSDDYPAKFTVIDVLSIRFQSESYYEMGHGNRLQDYIKNTLDVMKDKLSPIEKEILLMRHLNESYDDMYDYECDNADIYSRFNEMLNEHYQLAKIQRFEETRNCKIYMKAKLGDICIINQASLSKQDQVSEILYLDTSSVTEGMIGMPLPISKNNAPSRAQRKVKDKTILYSLVRPNLKHYGILSAPAKNLIVSTGFATIDVKDTNEILPEYLYYLLTQEHITNYLHGIAQNAVSAYPSLSSDDLSDLVLEFPPIEQQKAVARLLGTIDQKISLNKAINHNLEALAKQIYDYWFVQFDFPDENGRPYKSSGGKMVWNEYLKLEIPANWNVVPLKEQLNLLDSKRVPLSSKQREEMKGQYPYYGATGIMDYINDYIFDEEIILLAEDGSTSDANGNPIVQYIWGKNWVNNHAHIIISKNQKYMDFYYSLLKGIRAVLIETGSIQKKISQENLLKHKTLLPPQDLLEKFSDIVRPMRLKMEESQDNLVTLTKQRDELLPLLMNGQLSVNYDLSND